MFLLMFYAVHGFTPVVHRDTDLEMSSPPRALIKNPCATMKRVASLPTNDKLLSAERTNSIAEPSHDCLPYFRDCLRRRTPLRL
jgi:hypothetical protein